MPNNYLEVLTSAFEDELVKIAKQKIAVSANTLKTLGLMGAGAIGVETIRRANQDRRMGRAMRIQQGY